MPGYLVFEIEITNPDGYADYRKGAQPVLARYGGRFILRSVKGQEGRTEILEGDWNPERFFVVEFPSFERAREFYYSPDYQELVKVRAANSRSQAILVDGC